MDWALHPPELGGYIGVKQGNNSTEMRHQMGKLSDFAFDQRFSITLEPSDIRSGYVYRIWDHNVQANIGGEFDSRVEAEGFATNHAEGLPEYPSAPEPPINRYPGIERTDWPRNPHAQEN